ncbi:uncharacterized protein LOC122016308 isoform X1 [Zingiber officinale]|uniref:BTB domain-containing protein n=1 Tax=Zingiber officinale TaxID=94328 RepID=A0A8J5F6T3_ZINOF|nr:uncharacterized protein LOC122016308 isoform X1 [Zingiber officinale]KAG6483987.1 hypothetical protein ZIOFF_060780 [Zingiber officinale]
MAMVPPPSVQPSRQPPPPPSPALLQPQPPPDSDRSSGELRAMDCNLVSLCDHIQMEGFHSGAFSDVVVQAMGSTYRLHRLILSRSSYFRNMLHGPWKEAGAPTLVLNIDDSNVNSEAIAVALAYLYGHHPKLNNTNASRVLAAASFLDLQDLCAICTDFIISELSTSNFLSYQVFAESHDYGIHGERVSNACWGYLCQSATKELIEVLPKLSSQTLHALLTSDELWIPNEEKRFELALYTLLAKSAISEAENSAQISSSTEAGVTGTTRHKLMNSIDNNCSEQLMEPDLQRLGIQAHLEGQKTAHNILVELADYVVDFHASSSKPLHEGTSSPVQNSRNGIETARNEAAMEGPSGESPCSNLNNNVWLAREQSRESLISLTTSETARNDWGRSNVPIWGGRIVGRRQATSADGSSSLRDEEFDAFMKIFEGGSLLYCNMTFEALLNVRKQLEELGFPCKAVNDGLWLQMLLCHRVQAIGADTCKSCCLPNSSCACRQAYGYSHGGNPGGYYRQEHDRRNSSRSGNIYLSDVQGEGSGLFGPVRVHVRGTIDGLAGIGRGTSYEPGTAWPPTRYVYSRVPTALGTRNSQQGLAHDEPEARVDLNDVPNDGLTALVGLVQGNTLVHVAEQRGRVYEVDVQNTFSGGVSHPGASDISSQMLDSQDHSIGLEWEGCEGSSISLDLKTPLRHFPPFRFGVEFEDVDRLEDGQVKHSPEVFYAGSLWKVSVQAFNDEDPQGRRTLGLFLHRRKAELTDSLRKVHAYVDSREKVTARYQLICPSKREVMVYGSFKQAGTLLPKAPKGWGWRTALLFDELSDLLQAGTLRVTAVVQLV